MCQGVKDVPKVWGDELRDIKETAEELGRLVFEHDIGECTGINETDFINKMSDMLGDNPAVRENIAKAGYVYQDEDELQRSLEYGRKDLRLDFRSIRNCYQARGHVEHTDFMYNKFLQSKPGHKDK